jgi:hypothetical protein
MSTFNGVFGIIVADELKLRKYIREIDENVL